MACRIEPIKDGLKVSTPYNRNFVYDLKASVPSHERKWNDTYKAWIVHPKYGTTVQRLCQQYFREMPSLPVVNIVEELARAWFSILYVGASKAREDGTRISFAMDFLTNEWNVLIPEDVLRNWFEGIPIGTECYEPIQNGNLYQVLGLPTSTDDIEAIKTAYRRMAKQWHPDICKEDDAEERFKAINDAWQMLSDPGKKQMYDVGLSMIQRTINSRVDQTNSWYLPATYKPPLRCGRIDADYVMSMGRAVLKKIYAWEDIIDNGLTLVTSWSKNHDKPTIMWI